MDILEGRYLQAGRSNLQATAQICNMAALTSAKRALRREMKDILKNISIEERKKQSVTVFKKVSLTKVNKSIVLKSKAD